MQYFGCKHVLVSLLMVGTDIGNAEKMEHNINL